MVDVLDVVVIVVFFLFWMWLLLLVFYVVDLFFNAYFNVVGVVVIVVF